ncbi:heavy-metal-associated domain-containing protein [Eubacteriales bacterium OttesenSCG-928-A19]|nr:heavy-metal-associated domain-containing protein [Eubacteriales bacterium OttesenSCG-928-A19]
MKKSFRVEGLDCANCAAKMERGIQALSGVSSASLNFMTSKLTIEGQDDMMPAIIQEAEKIVRKVEPDAMLKRI